YKRYYTKYIDVKKGGLGGISMLLAGYVVVSYIWSYSHLNCVYYTKYIDVKKGGLGGISMLLAGYVVVSYIWSYSHLKHDRRRKYH
ncbi:PREDICTED: ATP synthase subunit f, mitochondrial, partial [Merops nubicus]|uniref:ATP synthase subunit f, mitochondrial n=1 Tax=Merops nubicus TaxID=57421 RepID=UPI0004EFFE11